ncbi:hypothetical protein [Fructilactobacillus florum]|uniref:Uncharacterized protein n=1 Tax=Fructilactobacillus florum DSM 22689 = JCM 16035 TaxID=1423745 RepID=A0A0R2CGS2_9LACO|nr:hypothetical protein [Fructilactobacillus florum]KRM90517.1 hypothetical protein FC87_GL001202 [Fructilactobacillus florum DSM 22689 = JCM 16035]
MEDKLELGQPAFAKMMFTLKTPVTSKNHKDYKFNEYELVEIAPDVWAMPVYMQANDDFTLFLVVTKIATQATVMALAQGTSTTDGQFALDRPLNTGEGLNRLFQHDRQRAAQLLHFFNLISKANEGDWRLVADDKGEPE